MRQRLLITYLTLLAAVLAGLTVPLAVTIAGRDAQAMFIDRLNDTARFASLAEPAMRTGRTESLFAELQQYDGLFGIEVAVVRRNGAAMFSSRAGFDTFDPLIQEHIDAALAGERAGLRVGVWPWSQDPMVVAEPVGRGGEVIGAVLTVSPTDTLHATTRRNWALLVGVSGLVLVVGVAAAGPLTRWMLRPVEELDQAARALAAGRFGDRVLAVSGPPELRHLIASFNTMAERIDTLIERQRSFVSYASHQLRTPLATLRLWVENLGPSVAPGGREDHRMVAEEIERMSAMCDALLVYARAEATADEVADVDAAAVADARAGIWSQAAEQAGIRLVRTGPDRAPVRAASQALDQALDALISNALKFAGRGAQVVVGVEPIPGGWVDIHVVDDGPGVSAADLAQLAQPFWRSPSHQNVDGSGLGVTVADALVTASGGRLDLLLAQPRGLHARIRLPAAALPGGWPVP